MPTPFQTWKVLPHGKLTEIDDNLLTVVGHLHMPLTDLPRRMTVVRLSDARLVIYSAIALDDDEMAALENYGRPAWLIVPNDHHRLDAPTWKKRYPDIQVVAPAGAADKVQEVVNVDTTQPFFDDPDLQWLVVPGTRAHEAGLLLRTARGTTLVLNDLIGNIRHESGVGGWLLRLMGFAGDEPQIPAPVRLALVKDTDALRDQLLGWSEIPTLHRILVSHGEPIEVDPRGVLRDLAASLG